MEVRETFNLRWDWFEANTKASLVELREETEFHDITLVVSDGSQVKANKMVLAGGSKFFHKILRENPHPHPLIYLKDVAHKHLLSVMDYLYTGQVTIQEEDLKKFLETAEDLKIKGLVPPDEQTNSLPETIAPPINQPSAEEHDREKRQAYSPNANPATHQSQPASQEQVASKSVVSSQSHASTEELAREKKKTFPATDKSQVDIQGQVSAKSVLLSQSPLFPKTEVQSNHKMYHSKVTDQGEWGFASRVSAQLYPGSSPWENVSSSQCQSSANEYAQSKTRSSHKATPALRGQIKTREKLPSNVSPPQTGNSFQNSNTCKVKVEVPVGDANDYNVHYEINDQGQHYISRFSERVVANNEQNLKYLSEQNEAMDQGHEDQITTKVPKEEPIMTKVPKEEPSDSNSTTFHTKVVENEEASNDWYEDQSTPDSYEQVTDKDGIKMSRSINNNDKDVHKRSHLDGRPFQCSFCPIRFSQRSALTRHLRIHTGERPYQCSECPKTFNQSTNLKTHMKSHTGEKPYQCSQCSKTFIRSTQLTIHARSHTGEKPYQCSQCPKTFNQSANLKTHMKIHTGEKPFQCSICPQRFSQKIHLITHATFHTGEKPYQCPQCFKKFRTPSDLCNHKKIHKG